jgi:hypothetical protein
MEEGWLKNPGLRQRHPLASIKKNRGMGTWNTTIKGNDTTLDIYQNFFDRYNEGQNPIEVSKSIKNDFKEYFQDSDDRNNSLLGLALAQWETNCLEPKIYKEVKEIIDSKNDLKLWKELGADERTINRRKKVLDKFLNQISTERPKPKRRVRPKFDFSMKELLRVVSPDNKKEFVINEEFTNQKYIHTSSMMNWFSGGGSGIMYYVGEGKQISAKWIDSQTLEITHEPNTKFHKKDESSYFFGDEVKIIYKEK